MAGLCRTEMLSPALYRHHADPSTWIQAWRTIYIYGTHCGR